MKIEGFREFRDSVRKASADLQEGFKEANAEAAAIAADGARSRVPTLSGLLASTIRSTGTKASGIIRAGKAAVPYAEVVHWGWPFMNIRSHPFLSDGTTETEPQWLPVYERRLEDILSHVRGS